MLIHSTSVYGTPASINLKESTMLFLIIFTIVAAILALGGLFVLTFIYIVFIESRGAISTTKQHHQPTLDRSSAIVQTPISTRCQMS